MSGYACAICQRELTASEAYEYRGAVACDEHFDALHEKRDFQRAEIIAEESAKLKPLRGLDFGDNAIGRANRDLLKPALEIARKESCRLKDYEGRK